MQVNLKNDSISLMDRRFLYSVFVSIILILFSIYFLRPVSKVEENKEKQYIAKVEQFSNEVQKKSKSSQIWVDLKRGEQFENDDLIRTSSNSYAEVSFLETKAKLKVGNNSTILISKKQDVLDLEMLEGNIFVEVAESNKIELKAKGKKFKVENAKVGMDVKENGDFGIDVIEGSVGSENLLINKNNRFEMNANRSRIVENLFQFDIPQLGKDIRISRVDDTVLFKWKSKEIMKDYKFLIGKDKNDFNHIPIAKASLNEFSIKTVPGLYYWKIIAKNSKNEIVESPVIQSHFVKVRPPKILGPEDETTLNIRIEDKVEFRWLSFNQFSKSYIEVATDKKFENIVIFKDVRNTNSLVSDINLEERKYYWRIRSNIEDDTEEVVSKISEFELKYYSGLKSPVLTFPENHSVYLDTKDLQVNLSWEHVSGAKEYEVQISGKSNFYKKLKLKDNVFLLENLLPGTYEWKVWALDDKNNSSQASLGRSFVIQKVNKIKLAQFDEKLYFDPDGIFSNINWNKQGEDYFEVKVLNNSKEIFKQNSISSNIKITMRNIGNYSLQITGYKNDQIISQSDVKDFQIVEYPLLISPQWDAKTKALTQTDGFGSIELKFNEVANSYGYLIEVRDLSSRIIRVEQTATTNAYIRNLLPGDYLVFVRSVDKFNRKSELADALNINVPNTSGLSKPTLNKVRVR